MKLENHTPEIKSGSKLIPDGMETKHAIGTVGHVLGDFGRSLDVDIDDIGNRAKLTSVIQFERGWWKTDVKEALAEGPASARRDIPP